MNTHTSISPQLEIRLLGEPEILMDKQQVKRLPEKTRALLFYIALIQKPHSRLSLATMLWEETSEKNARSSLRKAIAQLQKTFLDHFVTDRQSVMLSPSEDLWIDVVQFEEKFQELQMNAATHEIEDVANLYRGDFLSNFEVAESSKFHQWRAAQQNHLRAMAIELHERLSTGYATQKNLDKAIRSIECSLELAPWREEAHRSLIMLLARNGERSKALRQYETCVAVLKSELDIEPSAETTDLYKKIQSGHFSFTAEKAESAQPSNDGITSPPLSNLPVPLTSLVGRHSVLTQVIDLFQREEMRLVTLTGPGGVGKTRLALQLGSNMFDNFVNGVIFVELASIRSPLLAPVALAEALGIRETATNLSLPDHILDYLRNKQMLLILDNFEHIIEAAPFFSRLVANAPHIQILVTSREVLHVQGEFEFPVPPLELPHTDNLQEEQNPKPSTQSDVESVQLFIERARAVNPTLGLDERSTSLIADICTRLDGLPLAIELAAARVKMLDVESIAKRIEQRFDFLQRGPRDAPARHQTLLSAIDWSYDLLSDEEQFLFKQLSVFVGGCTLSAIESVSSASRAQNSTSTSTLDILSSLVDKSLVQRLQRRESNVRFGQLKTIIEYGQHKLSEDGVLHDTQSTHASYFLEFAQQADPMLYGPEQATWLAHLRQDHDNLRMALRWLIQIGDMKAASKLGIALWHFWYIQFYHLEGSQWLEQLLELNPPLPERAKLLYGLGMLARRTFDDDLVIKRLTEALALFRRLEDEYYIASTLRVLGFIEYRIFNYETAQTMIEEALALFRNIDSTEGIAVTLMNLGYVTMRTEGYSESRVYIEESLAIRRSTGNQFGVANCLDSLALVAVRLEDYSTARDVIEESMQIYRDLGNFQATRPPNSMLGTVEYAEGFYTKAEELYLEACLQAKYSENWESYANKLVLLSLTKLRLGNEREAIELLTDSLINYRERQNAQFTTLIVAAASQIAFSQGRSIEGLKLAANVLRTSKAQKPTHYLMSNVASELEQIVAKEKENVSPDIFALAWAEGEAMSLEEGTDAAASFLKIAS